MRDATSPIAFSPRPPRVFTFARCQCRVAKRRLLFVCGPIYHFRHLHRWSLLGRGGHGVHRVRDWDLQHRRWFERLLELPSRDFSGQHRQHELHAVLRGLVLCLGRPLVSHPVLHGQVLVHLGDRVHGLWLGALPEQHG